METREIKDIEIAYLDLCYAHTRIDKPERVLSLAASIERTGQIVPVIVLKPLILIDGYLRVAALRRLGRDTVTAEIWECTEGEALAGLLARSFHGKRDMFEEAALVAELHDHCNLSQAKIASMVGRTQGWVSGRVSLYHSLSEDLVALIRKGSVSAWTVTRIIAPIARAIPEHGKILTENLSKVSASTREMALFFHHWRKANRRQRENMVREPALFLQSIAAKEEDREAKILKDGPEGKYLRDLRIITHMLKRLIPHIPSLFSGGSVFERRILLTAFGDSQKQFKELEHTIGRYHDYRRDPTGNIEPPSARNPHPADRQNPEDLPEYHQAGNQGKPAGAQRIPL